jgi:hypothetical protein
MRQSASHDDPLVIDLSSQGRLYLRLYSIDSIESSYTARGLTNIVNINAYAEERGCRQLGVTVSPVGLSLAWSVIQKLVLMDYYFLYVEIFETGSCTDYFWHSVPTTHAKGVKQKFKLFLIQ